MKVLYFDTLSLLYSNECFQRNASVHTKYKEWFDARTRTLFEIVEPDYQAIEKLRNASSEAGLLLYPLGAFYNRAYLIEHGVFSTDELAPDTELPFRMHMNDYDPVRRMIAHEYGLKAQWYVCGEIVSDERLQPYSGRYLRAEFGKGVTSELISQIRSLKLAE